MKRSENHSFSYELCKTFKNTYRISSNKHPRDVCNFEALACDVNWRATLKKGRDLIQRKFQSFAIFSFKIRNNK